MNWVCKECQWQEIPPQRQTPLVQHRITILLQDSSLEKNFCRFYFGNGTFSTHKILQVRYFDINLKYLKKSNHSKKVNPASGNTLIDTQ